MAGSLIIRYNKWYGKFRVNGVQKLRSLGIDAKGGRNKRKAQEALDELVRQYSGLKIDKDNIYLFDFFDNWLKEIELLIKPATWESYDKTVQGKLKHYFDDKQKLSSISSTDLTEYFCYLSVNGRSDGKGGLGYKSVKNIRGVLSSAFEYAVEKKYIKENPVIKSRMPVFADKIKEEVPEYNADEIKLLLRTAKEQDSHIYIFLLLDCYTGLRKGELFGLEWKDISYERKLLNVTKSRTGTRKKVTEQILTPKTDCSVRKIPLNDFVLSELKAEQKRQRELQELLGSGYDTSNDLVIRNKDGKPYSNLSAINRVLNRLEKKAGLHHCTIHGLRHSVASILDDNGTALQDIAILLGHKSTATTERVYIKRRRKAKVETIDTLNNAISLLQP